jgi:hypothetical protein
MRKLTEVQVNIVAESYLDSYWFAVVDFPNGEQVRVAGRAIDIDGQSFEGGIMSTSGLRASLGASVDRIDVTVENIDWKWTRRAEIPQITQTRIRVGRVMRRLRGDDVSWVSLTMLSGIVAGLPSDETRATLQAISDLYAAPAVGALRPITRSCPFKYRHPRTCGAALPPDPANDPLPTCNKIFDSPDGCLGRSNQHHYGGFLYDVGKDTLIFPPPDPNSNPDPGGGGIGGNGEVFHKNDIPYLLGY